MRIALKIGDEESQVKGLIFLNAVTAYSSLSGKVTSFPVDSGVNIADHFISNNQKFTVEGELLVILILVESLTSSKWGEKTTECSETPLHFRPSGLKYLQGCKTTDTAPTVTS